MKREALNGLPPLDIDKEVRGLKMLIKETEARLAPGEEITPEIWEMLKQLKKTKSK